MKNVSSAHDKKHDPMRAALPEWDGHMLNESYKMPVPNASGTNYSYKNPVKAEKAAVPPKPAKNMY